MKNKIENKGRAQAIHNLYRRNVDAAKAFARVAKRFDITQSLFSRIWERSQRVVGQ